MNKITPLFMLMAILALLSCKSETEMRSNPFFAKYNTPFNVPPFDEIKNEHYKPAFIKGMEEQNKNIDAIVNNAEPATFENTIEALEYSQPLLQKAGYVFYNLTSANTNDTLKEIAKEIAPMLSAHNDNIMLNVTLFERIKTVFGQLDNFSGEERMLIKETYDAFVRGGANLKDEDKDTFRQINKRLSVLTLQFGDNVLSETNNYYMVVDNEKDLSGLSKSSIDAAAQLAKEKGQEGKWIFTTHKPSMIPFLQYANNRDLREKIFKAYINRGDNNNEFDNKEIIKEIIDLRIKRSALLGYENHAAYVLEKRMAKNAETVYEKINSLMEKSLKVAQAEANDMQKIIDKEDGGFKLEPWDWWYYAEKVKLEKYNLEENEIRPYFELNKVISGAFYTANQLYGLKFEKLDQIPLPHPDAMVYEVKEEDGEHIGLLYMDYHPRASKRGGAWMSSYQKQLRKDNKNISPIITMVCNFTSPTSDAPSLLSVDEVETLFHEFGHALHGLLSDCKYESLSGTAVPRDFVELPSQIMEHWAIDPELLKVYAKHYKTGGIIPDELISKIENSGKFNQGFITTEYLAAAILDMDYHTLSEPISSDPNSFENTSFGNMKLMPEIVSRYRSTYFLHIFSDPFGYSAGYYAYIWSAILDSDAFQTFRENGIFDRETGISFRKNILEKGGTENPEELYKRFKGSEPDETALLKDRGLIL